ncbi:UPF0193 protein EVG1 [Centroberyx gerrardi]
METSSAGRGMWNCPRASQYSKETQDMLKLMMQESRLTNFQQRQINECLKKGAALPLTCNPTSSAPPPQPKPKPITPGPSRLLAKPQRRSAESCRSGNSYAREKFRPCPTRDLEKEKRRLQNILATGQEEPNAKSFQNVPADQSPGAVEERDRFQEVLDEIEERRQFLADMTALGQGKRHHNLINTEISQKIRELEVIDKARSAKMKAAVMCERKKENTDSEETGARD